MREVIRSERWSSALMAGVVYFMIVFGVGFLLGTFRVLVVIPAIGEISAVVAELPIILAISWLSCERLISRFDVVAKLGPRLAMGGLAFSLLMIAEVAVSVLVFGRTFTEHLESYWSTPGILGLVGQLAFGMFPALQLAIERP
jgi:hypothetical protein